MTPANRTMPLSTRFVAGRTRRSRVIPLLVWLAAAASVGAQSRPLANLRAGTSMIKGTVLDAETKEPLSGCTVRAGADGRVSVVTTGPDGRYEFARITEGSYSFGAECPTHLRTCVRSGDTSGAFCSTIALVRDQQQEVNFEVLRGAIVRGRVIDSTGAGVSNATVRLGGQFFGDSVISMPVIGKALSNPEPVVTRPDGTFELTKIAGGPWLLAVDLPQEPGAPRSHVIFYPGVLARESAAAVEVKAASINEGVIITIPPVLERTLTVRVPPADATMTSVKVELLRAVPFMTRTLDVDVEGAAMVKGLIDGRYYVVVTARSDQQRWVDYQVVEFLETSVEVALQPQPAGRIRGRVIGDRGLPPLAGATIGAAWVDGDVTLNPVAPDEAPIAPDGSFEIDGLFGRRVLLLGRFDGGWRIHSVLLGRTDVTETGVDVTPGATTEVTITVRPR